ncbi:hydrogenase assembly chaperone hypC/hupF [Desulfotomaculum nigrificans CO-1-SRB]|uniref:Hydrogenase assembly chaperone hypC/hupF n=1 Tax=Desulfotomaculum nigrificans (strain DSM 14880 / VKM B-2319 / CO-1-SRB) TaxID=868595 RepID=F6B6H8_DESCC|nr:HypC/HybG/HupF family hydrogenase formation chaperone [Desulfotomaculum nigrificans]AEF93249.1 hydrogenase assembly chaperone hypC/hupF [Desulfotomaculum nigrificans CO-1-SRB]
MCVAVPLKVVKVTGNMAIAELEGISKEISIALTPEVNVGDWVLVHAGYAIHRIDNEEARETIRFLEELYEANCK